ncbi:uncharacterized protein BDZ99DRAFT_472001 [Mytilinidion resinicola]|uniref:Uncharacterized protein n=1 Tax=Mytilinidion resinicola TaxID=574789 RepID=A0A6A6Z0A3_9PEZI|nr:uncharacterized protein BDZ99DRAFT_472001 [Mytilinidion resinicola]KAF2814592.1 hypothetical protein BDZ99DRAFT_472001 [Mytilinidion resinicola]
MDEAAASQLSTVAFLQPWVAQDLLRVEALNAQASREKYHRHLARAVDAGLLSLSQAKCEYHPPTEAEIAAGLARTNDTADVYFASRDTVVHRRPPEVEELLQVFDKGPMGAYVLHLEAEVHRAERVASMAKVEVVAARDRGWMEAKEEVAEEWKVMRRRQKELEREIEELSSALGEKLGISNLYLAMRAQAFEAGRQDIRDEIDACGRIDTAFTQRVVETTPPDDAVGESPMSYPSPAQLIPGNS